VILLLIAGGLVLLVAGAEWLVAGAARLAESFRVSSLVVGLTVVAFGTSAPELAVSVDAALSGDTGIALGNVVGSNIFNIWIILGVSALVAPLMVGVRMIRIEVPIMIAVSVLLVGLAWNGRVDRGDGAILLAGLVAYLVYMFRTSRREQAEEVAADEAGPAPPERRLAPEVGRMAVGLVLLVVGSGWLVDGARRLATSLGVADLVIGLTIVAAGTSLPEFATSVVAARRGQREIAIGNVVGSNVFNVLAIMGVAALVPTGGITVDASALALDLPVMLGAAVVCLPVFFSQRLVSRWEGGLFIALYVGYAVHLGLSAAHHPLGAPVAAGLLWVGLPAATLVVLAGFVPRKPSGA
jgi:cation:H+ antiporter